MATKKTELKVEESEPEVPPSVPASKEFISTDELASSTHPKAPEVPIEIPKESIEEQLATTEPAEEGEEQPEEAKL